MKINNRKLTIISSLVLVGVLTFSSFALFGIGSKDHLLDQAVRREGKGESGISFIDPGLTALAGELSGTAESQAVAKAAFAQVNDQRKAAGLTPLSWSNGLEQASDVRAVEAAQVWSHSRPDGTDYWTVNSSIVYGENLAKGFSSAEEAVNAWMNSVSHRDNILYPDYRTAAIAIHIDNGNWYWANEFGY
ncbi:MAG: CAP domain-containing protein [Lachnospiraceae bacterium]|nr:CAP domain-containing protein [Lachnospiraceae bacterium]